MNPLHKNMARALYSVTRSRMLQSLAELEELQWQSTQEQMARQRKWLGQLLEYVNA